MKDQIELQEKILNALQTKGLPAVMAELERIQASADQPWKKSLVKLALDTVATKGPSGFEALKYLIVMVANNQAPDLSALTLGEASDLLAVMQRQEAEEKENVKDFLNSLLQSLLKVAEILAITLIKEI